MKLIVDAAPLVAMADSGDPQRDQILEILRANAGSLFLPSPVTAEVDYLLAKRFGPRARRAFLEDLSERRYETPTLDQGGYAAAATLDRRYADLNLGLADLSVAVLAQQVGTRHLLTFDERHFRTVEPIQGGAFTLLPADQK